MEREDLEVNVTEDHNLEAESSGNPLFLCGFQGFENNDGSLTKSDLCTDTDILGRTIEESPFGECTTETQMHSLRVKKTANYYENFKGENTYTLESFLLHGPLHCKQIVLLFLDFQSFQYLNSCSKKLSKASSESSLSSIWAHFAAQNRVLVKGNPAVSPMVDFISVVSPTSQMNVPKNESNEFIAESMEFSESFGGLYYSKHLSFLSRNELLRRGSLNRNWKFCRYTNEQRRKLPGTVVTGDRQQVIVFPPLVFSQFASVFPDSCQFVHYNGCGLFNTHKSNSGENGTELLLTVSQNSVYAICLGSKDATPHKLILPILPKRIPLNPQPILKWKNAVYFANIKDQKLFTAKMGKHQSKNDSRRRQHKLNLSWVQIFPGFISKSMDLLGYQKDKHESCSTMPSSPFVFTPSISALGTSADAVGSTRILCVCLPPIDVEKPSSPKNCSLSTAGILNESVDTGVDNGLSADVKRGMDETDASTPVDLPCADPSHASSVSIEKPHCGDISVSNKSTESDNTPHQTTNDDKRVTGTPGYVLWPVALCCYSLKSDRLSPQAVVCLALPQQDSVTTATAVLWPQSNQISFHVDNFINKNKGIFNKGRGSHCLTVKISTSIYNGFIAVGTTDGEIFCTPPPLSLLRRCCCDNCFVSFLKCHQTSMQSDLKMPEKNVYDNTDIDFSPPVAGSRTVVCERPVVKYNSEGSLSAAAAQGTAVAASGGVGYHYVGKFDPDGASVEQIHVVVGCPWERDDCYGWHFSNNNDSVKTTDSDLSEHSDGEFMDYNSTINSIRANSFSNSYVDRKNEGIFNSDDEQQCSKQNGRYFCGGVGAMILWLFASSKRGGVRIYRYEWSNNSDICGSWTCAFTIKGALDLISIDIYKGIIAATTPTEARAIFVSFKSCLAADMAFSNGKEFYLPRGCRIENDDLVLLCGSIIRKPLMLPQNGFLAFPWGHSSSVLQSPAQAARLEVMTSRKPSFLICLGGSRYAIVVGNAIQITNVEYTVKDNNKSNYQNNYRNDINAQRRIGRSSDISTGPYNCQSSTDGTNNNSQRRNVYTDRIQGRYIQSSDIYRHQPLLGRQIHQVRSRYPGRSSNLHFERFAERRQRRFLRHLEIRQRNNQRPRRRDDCADGYFGSLSSTYLDLVDINNDKILNKECESSSINWTTIAPVFPHNLLRSSRLCVFSHDAAIYQCAYDGVRRLFSVSTDEYISVWDCDKRTKLFGRNLLEPPILKNISTLNVRHFSTSSQQSDAEYLSSEEDWNHDIDKDSDTSDIDLTPPNNNNKKVGRCGNKRRHMRKQLLMQRIHNARNALINRKLNNINTSSGTIFSVDGFKMHSNIFRPALELQQEYDALAATRQNEDLNKYQNKDQSFTEKNYSKDVKNTVIDKKQKTAKYMQLNSDSIFPPLGICAHEAAADIPSDNIYVAKNNNDNVSDNILETNSKELSPCAKSQSDINDKNIENISNERRSFASVAARNAHESQSTRIGWAASIEDYEKDNFINNYNNNNDSNNNYNNNNDSNNNYNNNNNNNNIYINNDDSIALVIAASTMGISPEELLKSQADCFAHYKDQQAKMHKRNMNSSPNVDDKKNNDNNNNNNCNNSNNHNNDNNYNNKNNENYNDNKVKHIDRNDNDANTRDDIYSIYATDGVLVGLPGRLGTTACRGPNSQKRSVTYMCVSENILSIFYKEENTWQSWIFSPSKNNYLPDNCLH